MNDKMNIRAALQSPKAQRYGLWILASVVLFGGLGALALPPIVRHVAVEKLGEALHRPVAIRRVAIDPFALSLTVEGVDVKEREGDKTFAAFERLYLNLQFSSLFRWGPVIDEIRLVDPKFRAVRLAGNRYNFSDLIDEFMAGPDEDEAGREARAPLAFSLNNIQISGGRFEFDDRVVGEKHVVGDIAVALPFVSSMAYATDIFVEPHFSANIDGAPLDLKGRARPFSRSRESEFLLALDGVELPRYFDYLPIKLPVKLESGTLDTNLTLTFGQEAGEMPRLVVSGTASVANLKAVEAAGRPLAAFKRLDVAVGSADVFGGRFTIDRVALDSPEIAVRASRAGTINWLDLLPETRGSADSGKPSADGQGASAPVEWSLAEASVTGGILRWSDESNAAPFRADVEAIDARIRNLDGQGSVADFEAAWKVDGGEALKVGAFTVRGGKLDLAKRRARIGDVRLKGVRVKAGRSDDGRIEWIEPPALHFAAAQKKASPSWTVEIAKSGIEAAAIRFEDSAVSPKAVQSIEGLNLELAGLSSEPGRAAKVKAAFRFNRRGEVAVAGKLGAMPLDADLDLKLKAIELLPLQAYFSEVLDIGVTHGHATVDGKLRLRAPAEKKGKGRKGANDEPGVLSGGFAGRMTVGDFRAVDKTGTGDFLHWKSLRLDGIDVRFGPESVSIGEIALADFFARAIVSPEGKLNLLEIVHEDGKADAAPAAAAESPEGKAEAPVAEDGDRPVLPIQIGKVTLRGGNVRFTDNFVKPNYTANLMGIGGSVTGLSSRHESRASLELRGSYDNVAPLGVSARINPLSATPYLDLQADVKGIDLTSLSTYSGKYAGYAIEKGKLSLFVKYRMENGRLEAENRVFLDQLTFGDVVDSPDATALPVRLAVALLKNRNGEIDVNLPISGSIDDPEFSVGGLIVQVVVNLLAKAATSPFALIGAMFGGEALSDVEFDPGHAALTPEAAARLESLAKALADRPALKFEIEGRADPGRDVEGLKRARLDYKVRALKREDARDEDAGEESEESEEGVEGVESETAADEVTAREYPALLERIYGAAKIPKPRNLIGIAKRLPVEEMEKRLLENSAVGDDDLKALGDRRAKAVRDWLVAHGVPVAQIFLLPSRIGAGDEGRSGCRADFSLR
jgi:outer membrane protein OmpA-like peptidoglycan-associated protein